MENANKAAGREESDGTRRRRRYAKGRIRDFYDSARYYSLFFASLISLLSRYCPLFSHAIVLSSLLFFSPFFHAIILFSSSLITLISRYYPFFFLLSLSLSLLYSTTKDYPIMYFTTKDSSLLYSTTKDFYTPLPKTVLFCTPLPRTNQLCISLPKTLLFYTPLPKTSTLHYQRLLSSIIA